MHRLCLLPLLLLPLVHSSNVWGVYKSCLSNRPLLTKSTTSAVIMSISDVLCQKLEQSTDLHHPDTCHQQSRQVAINNENSKTSTQLDWHRTRQVAITGFTWSGPISHTWYAILEHLVTIEDKFIGLILRMLLDAFIFSPIAVVGYFIWRTILEGGGSNDIVAKLRDSYLDALIASFRFWPCANIVNFSLVPVEYRVLYNNMLSLFWNGYLSHINSISTKHIEDERIKSKES